MKHEDRLSKLEETLRGFRIVTSGMDGQLEYKLQKPEKANQSLAIEQRLAALEKVHNDFRIIGGANVRVEGSMKTGYCINNTCPEAGAAPTGFPQNVQPPPPPPTGACCFTCDSDEHSSECDDTTESDCTERGGTFQGVETSCDDDPAPCDPLTGACCVDSDCSIQTEDDCAGMGGTYQDDCTDCDTTGACCIGSDCSITTEGCCPGTYKGDDTVCTPNPCEGGACCDHGCNVTTAEGCAGVFFAGSDCDPDPCPPCCYPPFTGGPNAYMAQTSEETVSASCGGDNGSGHSYSCTSSDSFHYTLVCGEPTICDYRSYSFSSTDVNGSLTTTLDCTSGCDGVCTCVQCFNGVCGDPFTSGTCGHCCESSCTGTPVVTETADTRHIVGHFDCSGGVIIGSLDSDATQTLYGNC